MNKHIESNSLKFGVVYIINWPERDDPKMISLEICTSFDAAKIRTEELIQEFEEEYGLDYFEHATEERPMAVMFNGNVTGWVYIVETNV